MGDTEVKKGYLVPMQLFGGDTGVKKVILYLYSYYRSHRGKKKDDPVPIVIMGDTEIKKR